MASFRPDTKPIISILLLALSYLVGLILSILFCILYRSKIWGDSALLVHATTLKVAFYSLSYHMLSYLVLSEIGLLTHSLLEQGKRFFIIWVTCFIAQHCPSASLSFWLGVLMIAIGGVMYLGLKHSITYPTRRSVYSICSGRSFQKRLILHAGLFTLLLSYVYNSDTTVHLLSRYSSKAPIESEKILFIFIGQPSVNQFTMSSAIRNAVNPWRADVALIGRKEDINGNLSLARPKYRWEIPEDYDWPDILSMVPEIGERYRKLFCRFQNDSRVMAINCLPDALGILLAHQYVAQQHIMDLKLTDYAYDWYAIAPLQYLYICNMEQLSSFSRHTIHIGHSGVDSAQRIQPFLAPSHLIVEALSYVSFVLSNPLEMEFIAPIGTLQEQFYKDLALPFEKFRSPGFTVENSINLNKALVIERLSGNAYSKETLGPTICPKTDIIKEWDIMMNFTTQLYSEPVPVVPSCADDRYDLALGCNKSTNNTLFFFDWQGSNFGDELSPRIIQSVTSLKTFMTIDRDFSALKGNVITGIGSILHDVMSHVEFVDTLHIWGSGAHERLCHIQAPKNLPKVHIHAVRGPLTARCLNAFLDKANMTTKGSSYAYGDPGLLVPFIYPMCQKARIPTCQVCILPHKSDEALAKSDLEFQRLELLGCAKTTAESPESIVAWIVGCRKVVSSSLHGIVVAEAFDIPSVWMQLSGSQRSESSFKYLDYYLGTGRPNATPVTELQSAIKSPSIEPIADHHNVWGLIDNFPYESWGGCRPLREPMAHSQKSGLR